MRAVMLVLACMASAAVAQETVIPPEEMLDRLVGNSAVLTQDDGRPRGTEYFPARERTFYLRENGTCMNGEISIVAGLMCFAYDALDGGLPHCFVSFETATGKLGVRSATTGGVQWIGLVQGLPFDCVDGLTS